MSTNFLDQEIGKNIQKLRNQKGLSVEDCAVQMGITRRYLAAIESGTKRLNTDLLISAAEALGVTPRDLVPDPDTDEGWAHAQLLWRTQGPKAVMMYMASFLHDPARQESRARS
jgi:transcriptional regulator with XRE-family HTH domain